MTNKPNYPIHTLASAPENSKPALEQLRQVFGVVPNIAGVIANSPKLINALTLREADYPPVQYLPREDVDLSELKRTDHATHCPYKDDCNYYSVPSVERSPSMRRGRMRTRILLLRRSRDTSPSTPTESMKSRSNFQRSMSR